MSKKREVQTPGYLHHKDSGQAFVRLSGQDHYLGPYGSAESRAKYDQAVAEWLERGRQPLPRANPELTIAELWDAYHERHVMTYYVKDGRRTSEQNSITAAVGPLLEVYGFETAASFTADRLKVVRKVMIDRRWCRTTINRQVMRIRTMFKWAAENSLVSASVWHELRVVSGLAKGRSAHHGARESDPVRPVAETYIKAVKPHVLPQVWAMVKVQELTGMRPGEVVLMRRCDLDESGKVWIYRPASHKNEHHEKDRAVAVGPAAQEHIRPYLTANLQAYLFSPADADAARREERHENRTTPMNQGNVPGSNRREHPRRKPQDHYSEASYRRAITRACELAFPPPAEIAAGPEDEADEVKAARLARLKEWRRNHTWAPNQLRHNAATRIRKQYGIDAARAVLGHASTTMTGQYAELDQATATDVMLKIG